MVESGEILQIKCDEMLDEMKKLKKLVRRSLKRRNKKKKNVRSMKKVTQEEMALERHCEVIEMVDRILDRLDELKVVAKYERQPNHDNTGQQMIVNNDESLHSEDDTQLDGNIQAWDMVDPGWGSEPNEAIYDSKSETIEDEDNESVYLSFQDSETTDLSTQDNELDDPDWESESDSTNENGESNQMNEGNELVQPVADNQSSTRRFSYRKSRRNGKVFYKCLTCQYTNKNLSIVKRHIEGVHEKLRKYACGQCTFASCYPIDLHRHRSVHSSAECIVCLQCGQAYKNLKCLDRHKTTKHTIST